MYIEISALSLSIFMDLIYIILELTSQIGSYRYHSQYKGWIYASIVLLSIEIGLRISNYTFSKSQIRKDSTSYSLGEKFSCVLGAVRCLIAFEAMINIY
jgi:hypothetical protein